MKSIRTNYIDASAIIKLIIDEEGHITVRNYFDKNSVFLTTSLCFSESLGVLSAKYKKSEISQENYFCACEELLAFVRNNSIEIHDVDIANREIFGDVENIMASYMQSKKKFLDLSDAFQLVTLKRVLPGLDRCSLLLVTADEYLAEAAKKEGFPAWYVMGEDPPPC